MNGANPGTTGRRGSGRRALGGLSRALLLGTFLAVPLGFAAAAPRPPVDDLAALNAQIIRDPGSIDLNMRYGALAEQEGKPELAVAAYERVLASHPGNGPATTALNRVRVKIQPDLTEFYTAFGAAYESNPEQSNPSSTGEFQVFGSFAVKDERTVGDIRWRTIGDIGARYHFLHGDLNYEAANILTGPLLAIGENMRAHLGFGGGIAGFQGREYYDQAVGALTLELSTDGATQTLRLRGGYRQFNPYFVSDSGFFADALGKWIHPMLDIGNTVIFTPWVRWSGIGGTAQTGIFPDVIDVTPGAFIEGGGKIEDLQQIKSWLTLAGNVTVTDRRYSSEFVPSSTANRTDLLVSPGASVIFPRLIAGTTDLRVDYNFIWNNSNDDTHDFTDHRVAVTFSSHF